jgi:hypothetical protein
MLVNEYKLYVSIQKSSKDATFWKCLCLVVPLCYEHAELIRRMEWTLSLKSQYTVECPKKRKTTETTHMQLESERLDQHQTERKRMPCMIIIVHH